MEEVDDASKYGADIDLSKYETELDVLFSEFGTRINCLITEPYLGGGYHPSNSYMQLLERFCRENEVLLILDELILDEVQSDFGLTGRMYAFEQ